MESTAPDKSTKLKEPKKSKKSDKIVYEHLEHEEHIYKLPDSYIGGIEPDSTDIYTYENDKIISRNITYVPGFYKIFDEIIVNAIDQHTRTIHAKENKVPCTNIVNKLEITIDQNTGYISLLNNGDGIQITKQEVQKKKIFTPEMIFGVLLTSETYSNNGANITGGKNGYGSKLTNIFSKVFIVETVDKKRKTKYIQRWTNNMKTKDEPQIEKDYKGEPYTKITFLPDYERFGMDGLNDDIVGLLTKRIFDCCLWFSNNGMLINKDLLDKKPKKYPVEVYLNNTKLECNLENYINMYNTHDTIIDKKNIFIVGCYRWEVAIIESPNSKFNHVSMINGISTFRGGKHVDIISTTFTKKCLDYLKSKKKNLKDIKPSVFKDHIWIFVKHIMESASYDSQTKEYCTTNIKENKCDFDDKFIEKFMKNTNIINKLEALTIINDNKVKTTTNKHKSSINVPKLVDANFAGTKKSHLCKLILTEGDSAMSSALAGLSAIEHSSDIYGVFPLKGKLLNVRDESLKASEDNIEISNIMKIIGLNFNTEYINTNNLRYNEIIILTDQDVDGFHIKGLLINLFDTLFPTLLDLDNFITCLSTPLVIATKGNKQIKFYNLTDYKDWEDTTVDAHKYKIKYFKGLGTSNRIQSQEYFKEMKLLDYYLDDNSKYYINMVFANELADSRKDWLSTYDKKNILHLEDNTHTKVSFSDFVNLELKHFSNYDNIRSIPCLLDGLKPSQRKILWSCIKKNLKEEIKVAQLAGYVSEVSEYHHGEASLLGCIVSMAQDFVGSNNLNLLSPEGQFGSRRFGGKDHASARYIFTKLNEITFKLFNKLDDDLLLKQYEDNNEIEPEYYIPLLPLILINGAEGIGTGYSTKILQYNPIDIITNIRNLLNGSELLEMMPHYRGFKGQIVKESLNKYISYGIIKLLNNKKNVLEISELPVGKWSTDYELKVLDKLYNDKKIESYEKYSSDIDVKYHITMLNNIILSDEVMTELIKTFKLSKPLNATNMHLYNTYGIITKYDNVNDIIIEFYNIRLEYYVKRKDLLLEKYNYEKLILENKIRFITEIISKKLIISNKEDNILLIELSDKNFYKKNNTYDYLLDMNLRSMTLKRLNYLQEQLSNLINTINQINNKTTKQLYTDDLNDFETEYHKFLTDFYKSIDETK